MKTFNTVEELEAALRSFLGYNNYRTFKSMTNKRLKLCKSNMEDFLARRLRGEMGMDARDIILCSFDWHKSVQGVEHWCRLNYAWKCYMDKEGGEA